MCRNNSSNGHQNDGHTQTLRAIAKHGNFLLAGRKPFTRFDQFPRAGLPNCRWAVCGWIGSVAIG